MPAEILRDDTSAATLVAPEPAAAPAPAPPPGAVPGAVDLSSLARSAFVTSPERIGSLIEAKGAAQQPAIEAARATMQSPMPSDAGLKGAEDRIRDVSAQQPMKGARAFLSPVEGEDPLMSIQKLVQAVGLFAGGIGVRGSAHGAARASVAALTGAIAGWNEGDRERGNRELQTWKLKSDEALKAWELENAAYTRALSQRGLSLDEKTKQIALIAAEHDNPIAAEQARTKGAVDFVGYLTQREDAAAKFADARTRLIQSHDDRMARLKLDEERAQEVARHNQELEKMNRERVDEKREAAAKQRADLDAAWSGAPLRVAAIDYATTGKIPPNMARGTSGQFLIPKLTADAIAWAKEQGIDPYSFPSLRADIEAARKSLTKLRGADVIQEASIRRLDGHFDKLIELSEKVPRSQRPVANEYILKGRRDWAGDVDTANYILQGLEVGMELAKAFVGTAQGDAATREEGRKVFAAGSTHEQVQGAVKTLRENIHRNLEMNKESEKAALSVIDAAMGGKGKGGGGKKKMTIRRLSDGKEFEGDEGAVPAGYERVGAK